MTINTSNLTNHRKLRQPGLAQLTKLVYFESVATQSLPQRPRSELEIEIDARVLAGKIKLKPSPKISTLHELVGSYRWWAC
jgi:hypothetical protein